MTATSVGSATAAPMRSPLWSACAPFAATTGVRNGYAVVETIERAEVVALELCDLTHLPRRGVRGADATAWLQARGEDVPAAPGTWARSHSGGAVARLTEHEYLLTGLPPADTSETSSIALSEPAPSGLPSLFHIPLQHANACIGIAGDAGADLLARLCAFDLRPTHFTAHAVTRMQMAAVAVTVLRCDRADDTLAYLLLVDSALARYLWDLLCAAAAPLGGGVVGVAQFG